MPGLGRTRTDGLGWTADMEGGPSHGPLSAYVRHSAGMHATSEAGIQDNATR
jgi:hypothetical protein